MWTRVWLKSLIGLQIVIMGCIYCFGSVVEFDAMLFRYDAMWPFMLVLGAMIVGFGLLLNARMRRQRTTISSRTDVAQNRPTKPTHSDPLASPNPNDAPGSEPLRDDEQEYHPPFERERQPRMVETAGSTSS